MNGVIIWICAVYKSLVLLLFFFSERKQICMKCQSLFSGKNIITKTCLYNSPPPHPLKPHFYKVKLGFTGVYIIFLISAQKHTLWVLVRTALPRRYKRLPTIYVLSRNMKISDFFYLKIFIFGGNIFNIFE